jgi:DNA repair exonuclease SbcCD ATPase subunit
MKEDEVKRIKEKVKEHLGYIECEQTNIDEVESKMDELVQSIDDKQSVKKKHQEILDISNELKTKYNRLAKEVKFFEQHDDCPTCKQGIEVDFKQDTIDQHSSEISKITNAREKLASKALEQEQRLQEISDIEDEISKYHLEASEHRANIKLTKNTLKGIKQDLEEAEKEVEAVDTSKIQQLEKDLVTYQTKQEQLLNDKEVLSVLGSMLKDGGIKTRIIKQYVPVMNKLINKYLASMDFFVDFQLDEGFNETIKSRFRDAFSYASFSEGEKARIDLALLLTWRAVSRLRNSVSTNLLIMDEVFDGSLDSEGSSSLFDILSNVVDDTNLFVISHNKADQFQDKFDQVIKFKKIKNFSMMEA